MFYNQQTAPELPRSVEPRRSLFLATPSPQKKKEANGETTKGGAAVSQEGAVPVLRRKWVGRDAKSEEEEVSQRSTNQGGGS